MARPRKYKSVEELESKIQEYINKCKPEILEVDGVTLKDNKGNVQWKTNHPTTAGLAYHLGFASKEALYYYRDLKDSDGDEDPISLPVKRAILYIEAYHAERLAEGAGGAGLIFLMKNMGYTDKQEIEHSGGVGVKIIDDIK